MVKKKHKRVYKDAPCQERGFHRLVYYNIKASNIQVKECIDCAMWGYSI